jgi:GTP-binding protein HflX
MANYRKAILITYPIEQVINEAISLADAAGYSVIKTVTPRQITKSRFGIGRGKAEEVKEIVKEIKPDVIIFDETIKPTQIYNLASLCKVEIIDRERLILEIFERRASTTESHIQIKLAQLRYEMARAREKVRLARVGEQPGFYGLGKYEADIYFLDIRRRAAMLKKKLAQEPTGKGRPADSIACWLHFCRQNFTIQQDDRRDQSYWTRYLYYPFYIYSGNRPAGRQSVAK